jgi:hypothetical protein
MKAIKILTMAALATAVFASCSNDEDLAQNNYPMDNVVRIMTSVDGMNTRASYGNSTDKLKSFGFCINNAGNTKYTYDNIMVTKDGSNWNPATQMLWQNSTTAVSTNVGSNLHLIGSSVSALLVICRASGKHCYNCKCSHIFCNFHILSILNVKQFFNQSLFR